MKSAAVANFVSARAMPRQFSLLFLPLEAVLLAMGCGGDAGGSDEPAGHVMVIDDGIDPSLPLFQGKVAAAYTVQCQQDHPDGGDVDVDAGALADAGSSDAGFILDEARAALLAELARPDETCHLRPGIAPKQNPFADLEEQRSRWNEAIHHNDLVGNGLQSSPLDGVYAELVKRLGTASFHGTATTGVIAHDNRGLRLVLVEEPLGSAAEVEANFTCLIQGDVDQSVALLSDPDVRRAYIARPLASLERDLFAAMTEHQVRIVNESFGQVSRLEVERLQELKQCKPIALRRYFAVLADLGRAVEQAHPAPEVLVVQAAGNEGAMLTTPEDSLECRPADSQHLLVGSYGRARVRSSFTNFGPCVDSYAPGENVVAPLPGNWVFPLSGTSFAAPLVARLLSVAPLRPFDVATARAALLALREPNRDLPPSRFPPALIYDPRPPGNALTLVDQTTPSPSLRPTALPSAARLRRALWIIRWAARHR
jgi:subtilisin family serine protease